MNIVKKPLKQLAEMNFLIEKNDQMMYGNSYIRHCRFDEKNGLSF